MRQIRPASPRSRFRWQLGLLLLSLPRRLIPRSFRDLAPCVADEPVPYPVGQARPRQLGGLPNQLLVLGDQTDMQGGRVPPLRRLRVHD